MRNNRNFTFTLLLVLLIGVFGLLLFGCTTPETAGRFYRDIPSDFREGNKIVVLLDTQFYSHTTPKEPSISKCISKGFKKLKKKVEIYPAEKFRNVAFRELKLPENYTTWEAIDKILINRSVLRQIESIGIRNIVLMKEPHTDKITSRDSFWTSGGGRYPSPPVHGSTKSTYVTIRIKGVIFDIKRRRISGSIYSYSKGKSWYYSVYLIPILGSPSTASVSKACKKFGEEVAKFIVGEESDVQSTEKAKNSAPKSLAFNPKEPWTGTWKVTGGQWGDRVFKLEQTGNKVNSIRGSSNKLKAKVEGNRLKGWYVWTGTQIRFDFEISQDGMSLKGKETWRGTYKLKGERQK
jgi:hypothetical protein